MDGKELLRQYIDACELIKESQKEIEKLKNKQKQIEQDVVKASSHEFPYTVHSQRIEGLSTRTIVELEGIEQEEKILKKRIKAMKKIKSEVDAWMIELTPRKQRIIRYRFFEGLTWEQVAGKIGRKATADSVRMEFQNFMKE